MVIARALRRGVDEVQLLAADHPRRVADGGVFANAAAEAGGAGGGALDLAEEVDAGDGAGAVDLLGAQADVGDHADEGGVVAVDGDELADGGAVGALGSGEARPMQTSEPSTARTRPRQPSTGSTWLTSSTICRVSPAWRPSCHPKCCGLVNAAAGRCRGNGWA